ncbi:MAG: hypothetical protein EOO77_37625 [Oxalobacteraceae bacterium]|nr:MAG: hypothetical protein EOO77_37625 [Oxalobacteraceae bacterium]
MATFHLGTGITVCGTIIPSKVIDRIYERARTLDEFAPLDVKQIAFDELGRQGFNQTIYDRTGEDLMGRWRYRDLIVRIEKGRWKWNDRH